MRQLATSVLMLVLVAGLSQPADADIIINFEDIYNDLGYNSDPATYYQSSDGVTFSGTYDGIRDGVSRGDIGNWDLEGTNGPAFVGSHANIVISFANTEQSATLDVGNAFGSTANYTVVSRLSGSVVDTLSFSITDDNNGTGTWNTATISSPFDEIEVSTNSVAFGFDNLQTSAVPEPSSLVLTALAAFCLTMRRRGTASKQDVT